MVNQETFVIKAVPDLHPLSLDYKKFWREEKEKCINGVWSGGVWMPGRLYFHANHTVIKLNTSKHSKTKSLAKPLLRDIDWEFVRGWSVARGFSGFSDDYEEHCTTLDEGETKITDGVNKIVVLKKELHMYPSYKEMKYVSPKEYIAKWRPKALGNPEWNNEAKNFLMIGSRGYGKSYLASNAVILYEFLFVDNAEILVGAGDSKYSTDLLSKWKLAADNLFGATEHNGVYYKPPLSRNYSGTIGVNGRIEAKIKKKVGGNWQESSNKKVIHHRSFSDNAFAANGTRPSVLVLEEAGMFTNLEDSFNACIETQRDSGHKFGSTLMIGTGGDMKGGGTIDVKKMMYDPEAYDIVPYEDLWEPREKPIGFFVPAYLGLTTFKTLRQTKEYGNIPTLISDTEAALAKLNADREKAKKAASIKLYEDELQNRPIKPSEAFLLSTENFFPTALLQDQLSLVTATNIDTKRCKYGYINEAMVFVEDPKSKPVNQYPISSKDDTTGCVTIWEFPPKEKIPYGMYVAGLDPYKHDKSSEKHNSMSVGALYIYKRAVDFDNTKDLIVATYIARPDTTKDFHEMARRLLVYYNAECLYENEVNNFYTYLEGLGQDYLLTDQPDMIIKEMVNHTTVKRGKGIHMIEKIKSRGVLYVRDWLLKKRGDGKINLDTVWDRGLLQELLMYNSDGNFDRVIGFMLAIINDTYKEKLIVKKVEDTPVDVFWNRKLYTRTKK